MAKRKSNEALQEAPEKHHNLKELNKVLCDGRDRVIEIMTELENLNDEKNEIRSKVKTYGITKGAFDRGVKRFLKEPAQREEEDTSDEIVMKAFGIAPAWTQGEMFDGPVDVKSSKSSNEQQQSAH